MQLTSESFVEGARIPGEYAFGVMDRAVHVAPSTNRNPHLVWSDVPAGTKSFVLICHDPDVPSQGNDVNQEGREIPASLPRVDFFIGPWWILRRVRAKLPPANFLRASRRAASPGRRRHMARGKASTISPPAMYPRRTITLVMTALVPRGTMPSPIAMYSPCMPWTHRTLPSAAALPGRKSVAQCKGTCWRRPRSRVPTHSIHG